jgi:hypothetical protein
MMGSRLQTTAMFQYFCLDDWVPADHLLRAIDRHVDFRAIRERLRPLYSDIGRRLSIRRSCCGSCSSAISMASRASVGCWTKSD